jgi:hypothetical protein
MSNIDNTYELQEDKSAHDLKFFFISKGKQDIIKAIQYSFVQELNGKTFTILVLAIMIWKVTLLLTI